MTVWSCRVSSRTESVWDKHRSGSRACLEDLPNPGRGLGVVKRQEGGTRFQDAQASGNKGVGAFGGDPNEIAADGRLSPGGDAQCGSTRCRGRDTWSRVPDHRWRRSSRVFLPCLQRRRHVRFRISRE